MRQPQSTLARGVLRAFWTAFIVGSALQALLVLKRGMLVAVDTPRYAGFADFLISSGWNYAEWIAPNAGPRLLHSGFVTLVAFLKLVGGSHWGVLLVVLNVLAYGGAAALVAGTVIRITGSARLSTLAVVLYAGSYEVFAWPALLLSDTTFALAAFGVWLWLVGLLEHDRSHLRNFAGVAAAVVALLLYRPSAIAIAGAAIAVAVLRLRSRAAVVVSALAVAAAIGLTALLLADPSIWPFGPPAKALVRFSTEAARGEVVIGRPETFIAGVDSAFDVLGVFLARFLRFFQFTTGAFSLPHNVLNVLTFVPTYLGFAAAVWLAFRGRLGARELAATRMAVLWTVSFALLHAVTQLDYDWRYRLPVMAPVVCVAAVGLGHLSRVRVSGPARPVESVS